MWSNFLITNIEKVERGKCFNSNIAMKVVECSVNMDLSGFQLCQQKVNTRESDDIFHCLTSLQRQTNTLVQAYQDNKIITLKDTDHSKVVTVDHKRLSGAKVHKLLPPVTDLFKVMQTVSDYKR